jgi:hypothetical protein
MLEYQSKRTALPDIDFILFIPINATDKRSD